MDPLVCTRYGQRMSVVAYVTDSFAIRRVLDHLGLSPPRQVTGNSANDSSE